MNCIKHIFYPFLMLTVCLASSVVDYDKTFRNQPRQFWGVSPLHYTGVPLPIAAPRAPLFNVPNQRQYTGLGGPTYVGVFPVLTGQQACPACPNATVCPDTPACPPAPECKTCAECQKCPDIPVTTTAAITKCGANLLDNEALSSAPNGTITVDENLGSQCVTTLTAAYPNTKVSVECTEIASNNALNMYNGIDEISDSNPQMAAPAVINKEYTSQEKTAILILTRSDNKAFKLRCTWKSVP